MSMVDPLLNMRSPQKRQARERRNISYECLDEIGGLAKGHSGKLLALHATRRITLDSLNWSLGGLGVKCVVVNDHETLKVIEHRLKPRNLDCVRTGHTRRKNGGDQ